uniref:NADH dehydrogenase subunit 4 n=1 Tax=Stagonosporopsis vannaccii TaxID=2606854 RepID=UPI00241141F7|nr:NADH dehydrogenase subunit 4 [Stagonosporopsis vannaccii]WEM32289.1 NADH dehydrogenase subunit 4 [Stagonosporopsis vannaccii]
MLLTSLLLTPIFGVVAILVNRENGISLTNIKIIALSTSILNFFISLVIFILFDFSTNQFQFVQEYHEISYFDFYLGVDGLSIYFILLTTIIIPISLLSNWKSISKDVESYVIIILLLESLLLAVFLVLDILLFYIFFESILPPLFILIGIFGSDNRVKASFYLFLYTLLGSLFLLLSILAMSSIMSTTDFDTLFKGNFLYITQLFLFYGIFIAFAVKTPTIFLNTWLLKAHVESPLGGSIILAAIVLKLSLYGILRLILPILPKAYMEYTYIIFLIGVITIVYASLSTLRTIDIKELIAYSSVSHAAVYLLGVFSNSIQGIEGAITLGLAHGFVSPGLFICAGGVLYDRSHTRVISFYRGVTQVMPLFAILFFILCLANCGAPLTLNFIGEFLSLYGVFERSPLYGLFASSSIIFSAAYTIYMFQRIAFGGAYSRMFTVVMPDLTKREFTILMLLTVPTVMLGIYPALILDGLAYGVSLLLYSSDILVAASSVPLSDADKSLLKEADDYYDNAAKETSSLTEVQRASNNNKESIEANINSEKASVEATYTNLNQKLEAAKSSNPSHADDFEERIHLIKDAKQEAINALNETKQTALELIDDQNSTVILLMVGEGIVAESLIGPCFIFVSTVLKLYSNKAFRYAFKVWLSTFKW